MMKKIIFNGIKNHKYDLIMYPAEFFELRIQEEIVRTDEYKSSFVYVEMDFKKIKTSLRDDEDELAFWEAALRSMAIKKRGSDVLGFLQDDAGVGLLLLDSKMEGWIRLQSRISEFCRLTIGDISSTIQKGTRVFVYPACIKDYVAPKPNEEEQPK
jgi:hypothetical protein